MLIILNKRRVPAGTEHILERSQTLEGLDAKFTIFQISAPSEVLARFPGISVEDLDRQPFDGKYPQLKYSLADISRTFPLFPGLELKSGSAIEDPIFVDLNGIEPSHFSITNSQDRIIIRALNGRIADHSGKRQKEITLEGAGKFKLLPLDLDMEIELPE